MKIEIIYINEAVRIRKKYLNNLAYIVKREDEIKGHLDIITSINEQINDIDDPTEKYILERLVDIDKGIDGLRKYIQLYHDSNIKLDEDQKNLYYRIKEQYPSITDVEIKEQIMTYIIPVNEEFFSKNKDLYDKLNN